MVLWILNLLKMMNYLYQHVKISILNFELLIKNIKILFIRSILIVNTKSGTIRSLLK